MQNNQKLLFMINAAAGARQIDWQEEISKYFASKTQEIDFFSIEKNTETQMIKDVVSKIQPSVVISVGGDGTLKLIATALLDMNIPIGILPAGSANGMAKELGIPLVPAEAFEIIESGDLLNIHMVSINNQMCIHLSDMGFNALVVKKFDDSHSRGMWGYIKACLKVLIRHPTMYASVKTDDDVVHRKAKMIVIANGARYGSGAVINPEGRLDDEVFEVIIVRRISFGELLKMMITHQQYNAKKTEIFRTRTLQVRSKHRIHFQIDGEYIGKINEVKAEIIPNCLHIIVPRKREE
jgi:diacylglycerol kinase (ATP)